MKYSTFLPIGAPLKASPPVRGRGLKFSHQFKGNLVVYRRPLCGGVG